MLLEQLQMLKIDHLEKHIQLCPVLQRCPGAELNNIGIVGADRAADLSQQILAVLGSNHKSCSMRVLGHTRPGNIKPAGGIGGQEIGAIRLMDGYA